MMRMIAIAVTLFAATPVFAAADAIAHGKSLYDIAGNRVGVIDRVAVDGSVRAIVGGKFVTLKAGTVAMNKGKATANITRAEISKL